MLVADLKTHLSAVRERSLQTTLADIEVDPEARFVRMSETGEEFQLDEQAERSLAQYLGISKAYLAKCPADLKATNLNYWLQRRGHAAAVVEATDDHWVTIHKPGLLVLPLSRVADVITGTLDPGYEIISLIRNDTLFMVDVATDHQVEVHPDERIEDRQVGDITRGGIRIVSNPTEQMAPVVQTYLHRLVCTNGLVSSEEEGTIRLKGHTIDDIFVEMEDACRRVLGDLDAKLAEYAALATRFPPGSPVRFAYQIGRERNLTKKVMDRIMERVNILPDDATIYDVLQVFTELANSGTVNHTTMLKLQGIGGELAFATEAITHRCGTCERILPEA